MKPWNTIARAGNRLCRSREGAWIETEDIFKLGFVTISRSREGAWIEIPTLEKLWPYGYSRSREGAWIEIIFPLV